MSQIAGTTKRRGWKRRTYFWVICGSVTVCALIYWEQTALLYVLSTLAMSALLLMVAFSDLKDTDANSQAGSGHMNEREPTSSSVDPRVTDPECSIEIVR